MSIFDSPENTVQGPNITAWRGELERFSNEGIVGPYHEGDVVNLTCTVIGGKCG